MLHWKTALATALCAAAYSQPGLAQAQPATILTIDVDNAVVYTYDISDYSKFATDPNITTPIAGRPFFTRIAVGDIVAVNDKPAKGLYAARATDILAGPNARAIADIQRGIVEDDTFEILQADGTPVGTIMIAGLGVGLPPLVRLWRQRKATL